MKTFEKLKKLFFLCLLLPFFLHGEIVRLRILQTTDLHGQYSDGKNSISAARLGSTINYLRQEAGAENTLYIDCGDFFQGTLESCYTRKGYHFAQLLNLWKCDAFIPGNHDFDFGLPAFIRNLKSFRGKILACNLTLSGRELPILPYAVWEKNGIKTGIVGLAPRFMEQWFHPIQLKGADFDSRMERIQKAFSALMREKPHIIILAMHQGEFHSERKESFSRKKEQFLSRLFREYPQIHLVLGGHTHQESAGKKIYRGQWYVQAPPHARGVAVADIFWDREKKQLVNIRSKIQLSGGEKPHRESARHLFPAAGKLSGFRKKPIGIVPALMPLKRREKSNSLSRLFGRSMLESTNAKIAFCGTFSNYIFHGGKISMRHIFLLSPYENPLVTIPLNPEELEIILKEQYEKYVKGDFQSMYGAERIPEMTFSKKKYRNIAYGRDSFRYFLHTPSGEKVLWEKGEVRAAFTAYALSGAGGRFPKLREIGKAKQKDLIFYPVTIREALANHIRKHNSLQKQP